MAIKLFGPRALLEYWKPSTQSRIVQPDAAGEKDVLRWGKVNVVGDGRMCFSLREKLAGRGFSCEPVPPLVQVGDRVCFEMTDIIKWTQVYKRWRDNKDMLQLLQTDLIGRLTGDTFSIQNFQILGDFVLVKPELRGTGGNILLPPSVEKSPEFVYYKVVQIGSTVELPIKIGQEIIINHGKVSPLVLLGTLADGGRVQEEYGYVIKDYVHGVVDDSDGNERALQA